MIPIDLKGKIALVAGVGDDRGFAWHISKALAAAGARLVFATHPRLCNVVTNILERDLDKDSRQLPFGAGELKVEKVIPCDVSYDTMGDVDEKTLGDKRFSKHGDYSIQGLATVIGKEFGGVDIFVHSIAFSPDQEQGDRHDARHIWRPEHQLLPCRNAQAMQPYMENRPDGGSAIGQLSRRRSRCHYGGMSTAKAPCKSTPSNWRAISVEGIRVNIISAGPYASQAASAIENIGR